MQKFNYLGGKIELKENYGEDISMKLDVDVAMRKLAQITRSWDDIANDHATINKKFHRIYEIFLNLFLLVDYKCFMYKNKKVDME